MSKKKIKPLKEYVLVRVTPLPPTSKTKSSSGWGAPDPKYEVEMEILAVGEDVTRVKPGQTALTRGWGGLEVEPHLHLIEEEDIWAVYE